MSQPPTSKYPDMGEVTGLRLELGRERDRANALEAALRKEVLAVIKDALSDNTRIIAENARLKAEVERLTVEADWKTPARKIQALEAEVERLKGGQP